MPAGSIAAGRFQVETREIIKRSLSIDDGRLTIDEVFLIADCGFLISKKINLQSKISNPKFPNPDSSTCNDHPVDLLYTFFSFHLPLLNHIHIMDPFKNVVTLIIHQTACTPQPRTTPR